MGVGTPNPRKREEVRSQYVLEECKKTENSKWREKRYSLNRFGKKEEITGRLYSSEDIVKFLRNNCLFPIQVERDTRTGIFY